MVNPGVDAYAVLKPKSTENTLKNAKRRRTKNLLKGY